MQRASFPQLASPRSAVGSRVLVILRR